jgi:hypothetical protein
MESLLLNGYSVVRAGERDPLDFLNFLGDFSTTALGMVNPFEAPSEIDRRRVMSETFGQYGESTAPKSGSGNMITMSVEDARALVGEPTVGGKIDSLRYFFDEIGRDVVNGGYRSDFLFESLNRNEERTQDYLNLMHAMMNSYDLNAVYSDLKESMPNLSDRWDSMSIDPAIWSLLYGPASQNAEKYRISTPAEGSGEGTGEPAQTGVTIIPDDSQLQAAIKNADGQDITTFVDGDTTELHADIRHEDGQQLTAQVDGDMSKLAAKFREWNGKTITAKVTGQKAFAEGGRATEASIFGEAGPEWAIPEEHSERTAELLNAAREASGFTWPDIIARFGGLNANARNTPQTIVYSPTINAQDATGVERALAEDKTRLEKWFREREMREEMEVFA